MFGIFADLITTVTTILFPIFASYKALRTHDPAQLTPWLMYWIVFSLVQIVENFFGFILFWIPFYSWMRMIGYLYLILPGQQGATQLYLDHVEPFLIHHETEIDRGISQAHDKAKALGWIYAQKGIEWVRVNVLGMQPKPPTPPNSRQSSMSYTQNFMSRFAIPAARQGGGDFYNLVSQALSGATAMSSDRDEQARDMTAAHTLIPDHLRDESERSSYIDTQRERLRLLLQAFDREAYTGAAAEPELDARSERLAKSRSEVDFDRIEHDEAYGQPSPRVGPPSRTASGGWMAWSPFGGRPEPPPRRRSSSSSEDNPWSSRENRDTGRSTGLEY